MKRKHSRIDPTEALAFLTMLRTMILERKPESVLLGRTEADLLAEGIFRHKKLTQPNVRHHRAKWFTSFMNVPLTYTNERDQLDLMPMDS